MERTLKRIESAIFDLQVTIDHAYLTANVKEVIRIVVEDLQNVKQELIQLSADEPSDRTNELLCQCIERISWRAVLILIDYPEIDIQLT